VKFLIDNRTKYPTRQLRSFVARAYRGAAECAGPARVAEYERRISKIRISFARANHRGETGSTGHAYYNTGRAHVGLGDNVNRLEAARVIAHEFGHCFGLKHSDMAGGPLMRAADANLMFSWAPEVPLVRRPEPAKRSTEERQAIALERAFAARGRWLSKQKRAETALRKLNAKIRRLQRIEIRDRAAADNQE